MLVFILRYAEIPLSVQELNADHNSVKRESNTQNH